LWIIHHHHLAIPTQKESSHLLLNELLTTLQPPKLFIFTVVGANLCVPYPLEIKDKGIRRVGGVAEKEALSVQQQTLFPSGSTL
jgi:hypothetical protein